MAPHAHVFILTLKVMPHIYVNDSKAIVQMLECIKKTNGHFCLKFNECMARSASKLHEYEY